MTSRADYSGFHITTARTLEDLQHYSDEWEGLCSHVPERNVFYEPWMLLPAVRHLAGDEQLEFLFITEKSREASSPELVAFVPLSMRRGYKRLPVRVASFWRYRHCYLCVPLVRRGYEETVVAALVEYLRRSGRATVLVCPLIDCAGPFFSALQTYSHAARAGLFSEAGARAKLVIDSGGAEAHLGRIMSKNFRKEMRRKAGRLGEQGELGYDFSDPGPSVEQWLNDFLELEARGWKGGEGSALQSTVENRSFARECLLGAHRQGKLLLGALRLNGRMIAGSISFRSGEAGFAFKIAYDEEYSRFSPGVLLEVERIKDYYRLEGLHWLDSCAQPESRMANRIWTSKRAIGSCALSLRAFPEGWLISRVVPSLTRLRRAWGRPS